MSSIPAQVSVPIWSVMAPEATFAFSGDDEGVIMTETKTQESQSLFKTHCGVDQIALKEHSF